MRWMRRDTIIVPISVGLFFLVVLIPIIWMASQADLPALPPLVQEVPLLVIVSLGLVGLYALVFVLVPRISERIMGQQAAQTVNIVRSQLLIGIGQISALREEIRCMMLEREENRDRRTPWVILDSEDSMPGKSLSQTDTDYMHLSQREAVLTSELLSVYRAMASLSIPHDVVNAKSYIKQALTLTADTKIVADLHYTLAYIFACEKELGESLFELQEAFTNRSPELDQRLQKDTDEGEPLYELFSKEPYGKGVEDLLKGVSVGKVRMR